MTYTMMKKPSSPETCAMKYTQEITSHMLMEVTADIKNPMKYL